MRRSTTAGHVLVAVIAAAGLLSGCGGSDDTDSTPPPVAEANGVEDLDADEILERVREAVDAASSVYVAGEGATGDQSVGIDMRLAAAGQSSGSLTIDGQELQLVIVDDVTYFSADEAFWGARVPPEVVPEIAGKFVEVPPEQDSFGTIATYEGFFGDLLQAEGTVEVGEQTTVDELSVIELIDTKDGGILYVALEGEPLPLKVKTEGEGELSLSEWNETVTVEAPAADEIVDPATLAP